MRPFREILFAECTKAQGEETPVRLSLRKVSPGKKHGTPHGQDLLLRVYPLFYSGSKLCAMPK